MNQQAFFVIDNKELSIEKVLVKYENEPIFFVCKNEKKRYLSVCRDIDNESYLLTQISNRCLFEMLQAKISMRKAMMSASSFWNIVLGETCQKDKVTLKPMNEMPVEDLPYEGACYQIATQEIEDYVQEIESCVNKESIALSQIIINNLHIENAQLLESFQKEKMQIYWQILQRYTQKCINTKNTVQLNDKDVYKHIKSKTTPAKETVKQTCISLAA